MGAGWGGGGLIVEEDGFVLLKGTGVVHYIPSQRQKADMVSVRSCVPPKVPTPSTCECDFIWK